MSQLCITSASTTDGPHFVNCSNFFIFDHTYIKYTWMCWVTSPLTHDVKAQPIAVVKAAVFPALYTIPDCIITAS